MADQCFFVGNTNVNFSTCTFDSGRPFSHCSTRSMGSMRNARSPVTGEISIDSNIRNRTFFWHNTNWTLQITTKSCCITQNLNIEMHHRSGATSFKSIFLGDIFFQDAFRTCNYTFNPEIQSRLVRMDSTAGPGMDVRIRLDDLSGSTRFTWGSYSSSTLVTSAFSTRTFACCTLSFWNGLSGNPTFCIEY